MTDVVTVPVDAERLLIDWLLTIDEITDLVDQRIYSILPGTDKIAYPVVRAMRLGGGPDTRLLWNDHPLIQFDVWGGPRAQARLVADTIRAHIAYRFTGTHDLGTVTGVDSVGGPQWLPDTSAAPARPRYTFDVVFTVHP